jgi:hypothetical protein
VAQTGRVEEDEDFQLRHEAAEELKRLVAHPVEEVERLEQEAVEGRTAASLGILVATVFVGVAVIAIVLYALVMLATRLIEG